MNRQRALALLGADPNTEEEELLDLLEDAVFNETQYFMRRAFIPKLSEARRKRLDLLHEVGEFLGFEEMQGVSRLDLLLGDHIELFKYDHIKYSLKELLQAYHDGESKVKHALSSARTPAFARSVYALWEQCFAVFAEAFILRFEAQYGKAEAHSDTKLSEWIDYNELMQSWAAEQIVPDELMHKYYSSLLKMST